MQLLINPGYEGGIAVGQRKIYVFNAIGPKSYSQTTKDVLSGPFNEYLDAIPDCFTVSGTYYVRFSPSAVSTTRATWKATWFVTSTNAEVNNSTDLSAEKIQFQAMAGEF